MIARKRFSLSWLRYKGKKILSSWSSGCYMICHGFPGELVRLILGGPSPEVLEWTWRIPFYDPDVTLFICSIMTAIQKLNLAWPLVGPSWIYILKMSRCSVAPCRPNIQRLPLVAPWATYELTFWRCEGESDTSVRQYSAIASRGSFLNLHAEDVKVYGGPLVRHYTVIAYSASFFDLHF